MGWAGLILPGLDAPPRGADESSHTTYPMYMLWTCARHRLSFSCNLIDLLDKVVQNQFIFLKFNDFAENHIYRTCDFNAKHNSVDCRIEDLNLYITVGGAFLPFPLTKQDTHDINDGDQLLLDHSLLPLP